MAEKLSGDQSPEEKPLNFLEDTEIADSFSDVDELKNVLVRMKLLEKQAEEILNRKS